MFYSFRSVQFNCDHPHCHESECHYDADVKGSVDSMKLVGWTFKGRKCYCKEHSKR